MPPQRCSRNPVCVCLLAQTQCLIMFRRALCAADEEMEASARAADTARGNLQRLLDLGASEEVSVAVSRMQCPWPGAQIGERRDSEGRTCA